MPEYGLSLLLLLVAGWIDALAYISFSRSFVSFMSGNTTKLAVGLGQGHSVDSTALALVLAAFFLGTVAGELAHIAVGVWRRPAILLLVALLLLATAWADRHGAGERAVTALLALAMGVQNAVLHRAGRVGVGLTYVTGTLVNAARSFAAALLGHGGWRSLGRYAGQWAALLAGATAVATIRTQPDHAMVAAAALVMAAFALALWLGPATEHDG